MHVSNERILFIKASSTQCLIHTPILFYRVLYLTRLILTNLIKSREIIFEYNLHELLEKATFITKTSNGIPNPQALGY